MKDYLRDDCPPQGSGHGAITCVAWPPQDRKKLLFRDGTSSRANRRRYSPAYKGDGSMLHPQRNSAGNNPDVIPSAKATKGSALETAQKLSHQRRATEDGIAALMRSVIGIAGFMLAIVSPTIASAATIEEVAHCRAVPQLAERLKCFKSLKPGPRAKTEDAAPEKKQDAGWSKVKDAVRAKQAAPANRSKQHGRRRSKQHRRSRSKPHRSKQHQRRRTRPHRRRRSEAASAKTEQAAPEQTAPAKTEQPAPEQAARAKTEQPAPEQTAPAKTEQPAPANTDEAAPAITETTTKSNTGEALFSPTPDDPATTSSIDRLSVAGQPLCVDAEALAAMVLAGLLTSDPTKAATDGCQTLPGDAKLALLERYPSVFPSFRIVRVRVTSPSQPDLTFGFTIETGR